MKIMKLVLVAGAALMLAVTGCKKKEEPKAPAKPAEVKKEEPKPEEPKPEEPKPEEPKPEEPKPEEPKPEEPTGAFDAPAAIQAGMAAMAAGNFDEATKDMADDIAMTIIGAPAEMQPKGKEGVKKVFEMWRASTNDVKVKAKRVFVSGDVVFVQGSFAGTHTGDFMGHAATNKPIGTETFDIYWSANGKLTRWDHYANVGAVMAQIGAAGDMPAPPVPALHEGEPEIVKGESNAAAIEAVKAMYAAPMAEAPAICDAKTADDAVIHDLMEGKDLNKAEAKASFEEFAKAMPDGKATCDQIVSIGNWTIATCVGAGTMTGDLGPMKATGKPLTMHFADVTRWEGDMIKEGWSYMNGAEMMAQIMPPPAPAPGGEPPAPAPTEPSPAPAPTAPTPEPAPEP